MSVGDLATFNGGDRNGSVIWDRPKKMRIMSSTEENSHG